MDGGEYHDSLRGRQEAAAHAAPKPPVYMYGGELNSANAPVEIASSQHGMTQEPVGGMHHEMA